MNFDVALNSRLALAFEPSLPVYVEGHGQAQVHGQVKDRYRRIGHR